MSLLTIAYSLPILVLIFMFLVLLRSDARKRPEVKYFGYFLANLIIWLALLWVSDELNNDNSLFTLNAAVFVGSFAPLFLFLFAEKYVGKTNKTINALLISLSLLFAISSLVGLMIYEVAPGATGVTIESSSVFYALQSVYTLLVFVFAIIWIRYHAKKSENTEIIKQTKYIIIATISAGVVGVLGGLILSGVGGSNLLSPLAVAIFVTGSFLAVFKHGLFDLKLIVARSAAYALTALTIGFIFGFVAFSIVDQIVAGLPNEQVFRRVSYTLLSLALAFSLRPILGFFNKVTNKIFYQDAYDSQALLDNLNSVLVSTLDLQKLLSDSSRVINDSIKSDYIVFSINSVNKSPQRLVGAATQSFSQTDLGQISQVVAASRSKTIVADELTEKQGDVAGQMRQNDIAVVVRLTDNPGEESSDVGYMILGNKKSGSPFSGQDIKVLEIIADELVIAIQNALRFEEIQKFNITLQEKVDDATKKLRDANKRLIELDQTKDDFISMASHQLRTPLTSIKGYVSMVMEGDAGKITKKQNELLNQSFISAQRMVYLIADLLNVSRLRTGKFVIDPEKTNLADVIDGEMAQLTETAKGRKIELKYNKPSTFPELMLDENKTRQVIMNFIDNAIYYTPTDGHVNVNLEDKGETIEFTVVDDGIGVPKSVQHNLFNKFYRADNAKKARPDGTGLGLFMAKKVVVAQGGSIIFRSAEGKGSTFGFSFNKKALLPENFKGVVADKK